MVRRTVQLLVGLAAYGTSMAMLVQARLGVLPWDVLHQGLARRLGLDLGLVVIVVGALTLLWWIPLRERPGVGTVANVLLVGLVTDLVLDVLPVASGWPARIGLAAGGIVLNALATAAYIGVGLGPGPRDGLMTGLVRRTGRSVRAVRTGIEVVAVLVGVVLGGTLGPATFVYALAVGPLVQVFLPPLTMRPVARRAVRT